MDSRSSTNQRSSTAAAQEVSPPPITNNKLNRSPSYLFAIKEIQRSNRMAKLREYRSAREHLVRHSGSTRRKSVRKAVSYEFDERTSLKLGTASQLPPIDNNHDEDTATTFESEAPLITVHDYLKDLILGKGLVSLCLLAVPAALLAVHQQWSPTCIFWLNFIVMIPLASILGDFTEEVALHTNETVGGLINASFGNAVEVVVAIQALMHDEIRVVQSSMLGSIFSNLLLVLGCCFFFGGIYIEEQSFNSTASTSNMGLLAMSSIAVVLPTPFAEFNDLHDEHVLTISRVTAIFLIFMYAQMLAFQLHTHAHVFGDDGAEELASVPAWVAGTGLCVTTALIALFSQYLVASIEGFTEASGVSRTFVGIIILPIVGNAVEHITAVNVAMKNKMDLAMGIAVGSCTQISLFVLPFSVIVGWLLDKDMHLNFPNFEIALYVLAVLTVAVLLGNTKSNWLDGSMLVTTYCLIAIGFWFESAAVLDVSR